MKNKINENDEILRWVEAFHTNGLNINPLRKLYVKKIWNICDNIN